MKSKEITAVAVRLVIIWLFFSAIISFPIWIAMSLRLIENKIIAIIVAAFCTAIACTLSIILWKMSNKLIRESNESGEDDIDLKLTPTSLEKLLLRCMGLYFLLVNLKPVVIGTIQIYKYKSPNYDLTYVYIDFFEALAFLFIGLFLIAKPQKWFLAIRKIRRL